MADEMKEDKPDETPTVFNIYLDTELVYLKWNEFVEISHSYSTHVGALIPEAVLRDIFGRTCG